MATRLVLGELADAFLQRTGTRVTIESVGGVDAVHRVRAGEAFDFAILASDAIAKLIASGHIRAGSKVDLVCSGVAVAVRSGGAVPDISTEAAVRNAVLAAQSISYSTGPSGVALARLFERWSINDEIRDRILVPPPGVPVGALIARGDVELGFQQLSELMHIEGINVVGPLPGPIQIMTTFSGGVCAASQQDSEVRAMFDDMNTVTATDIKRRHGMDAATA